MVCKIRVLSKVEDYLDIARLFVDRAERVPKCRNIYLAVCKRLKFKVAVRIGQERYFTVRRVSRYACIFKPERCDLVRCAAYLVNAYLLALEVIDRAYIRIGANSKFYAPLVQAVNYLYIYPVLDRGEELEVTVYYRDRAVIEPYLSRFKIG